MRLDKLPKLPFSNGFPCRRISNQSEQIDGSVAAQAEACGCLHNRLDLRRGSTLGSKVIRRKPSDWCLDRFITPGSFPRNSLGGRNYHMDSGSRTVGLNCHRPG